MRNIVNRPDGRRIHVACMQAQLFVCGEDSRYYERWLASFERLLEDKGLVTPEALEDRTEAFEFGERDEVY